MRISIRVADDDGFELEWATGDGDDGPAAEQRFVDAALRLLDSGDSYDELGVAQIARAAGRSVGAFYGRFPDKSALLHQLQIRLYAEGEATLRRAFELARTSPLPPEQLVRGFIELQVAMAAVQRGLRRAILVQMTRDHVMRQRATALGAATVEALTDLALPHFPAAPRDRIRDAMHVLHAMVTGALDQRLLFSPEPPTGRGYEDPELALELSRAAFAYLRTLAEKGEPR